MSNTNVDIDQFFYFDGAALVYEFQCRQNRHDLYQFVEQMKSKIWRKVREYIIEVDSVRWSICIEVKFRRLTPNQYGGMGEPEIMTAHFRSKTFTNIVRDGINRKLNEGFAKMSKSMEEFLRNGSGWQFWKCEQVVLKMVEYEPMAAAKFIPLPAVLKNKKAILNIKNGDDKCFVYCVLAVLHPVEKNAQRVQKYTDYVGQLNLRGLKFPLSVKQIPKFERQNEEISVNVFTWTGTKILQVRISTFFDREYNIDLLLTTEKNGNQHYALIKNFNKLMGSTVSKNTRKKFFCPKRAESHPTGAVMIAAATI